MRYMFIAATMPYVATMRVDSMSLRCRGAMSARLCRARGDDARREGAGVGDMRGIVRRVTMAYEKSAAARSHDEKVMRGC